MPKSHTLFTKYTILSLIFLSVLVSCKKDSDPVLTDRVVSYNPVSSYSAQSIEFALGIQSLVIPELQSVIENVSTGITVYRINYKTLYKDSVITASGIMSVPQTAGTYPVISFQNGTNTLHANAPSVNFDNETFLLIEFLASNGYIVLIPDYIGFGASSDILHPYYHRESTNNAIIDLIHAVKELGESGAINVNASGDLFLMGYSQGGGATISALEEIEGSDDLNMDVIAVSAGAGAYDLLAFSNHLFTLETFPAPFYLPYFVYAQKEIGLIHSPLNLFFKEPYASEIPGLFNGLHSGNEISDELTYEIDGLFTTDLLTQFNMGNQFEELRSALENNSIHGWESEVKIGLYHGSIDDNVFPIQSLVLYNEFIEAGTSESLISHHIMEGKNHDTGVIPWGIMTIEWFNTLKNN